MVDEFARIAAYPDGSPELLQFQQRFRSRIVQQRRALANLVNSPPGFGVRNGGTDWIDHLNDLNREDGFLKSVTMKDDLAAIETMTSGTGNVWRGLLARWKITGVTPRIVAGRPVPAMIQQAQKDGAQRVADEAARLQKKYGTVDQQAALARYRTEYDAASDAIEAAGRKVVPPPFMEHPPMNLDDTLEYATSQLAGGVPLVASNSTA